MSQLIFSTNEIKNIAALEAEKKQLEAEYKQTAQEYLTAMHKLQDKLTTIGESLKTNQLKINAIKQPSQ